MTPADLLHRAARAYKRDDLPRARSLFTEAWALIPDPETRPSLIRARDFLAAA